VFGQYIFLYNMLMTFRGESKPAKEPLVAPPKMQIVQVKVEKYRESVPLFAIGGLGLFLTMFFIVVILPYLLMDSPPSDISHPYTDEQAHGDSFS